MRSADYKDFAALLSTMMPKHADKSNRLLVESGIFNDDDDDSDDDNTVIAVGMMTMGFVTDKTQEIHRVINPTPNQV